MKKNESPLLNPCERNMYDQLFYVYGFMFMVSVYGLCVGVHSYGFLIMASLLCLLMYGFLIMDSLLGLS